MKTQIMIDLETFGTKPGCVIAALGAVVFDRSGIVAEFYRRIDIQSCVCMGLKLDVDTMLWWMKKSDTARAEITRPADCSLNEALLDFMAWKNKPSAGDGFEVWGNGADFDNPILEAAFDACQLPAPWCAYEGRCYRTMKNLFPHIAPEKRDPNSVHNALDDAKAQALHLIRIFAALPAIPQSAIRNPQS